MRTLEWSTRGAWDSERRKKTRNRARRSVRVLYGTTPTNDLENRWKTLQNHGTAMEAVLDTRSALHGLAAADGQKANEGAMDVDIVGQ